jgi:hypothetical protein
LAACAPVRPPVSASEKPALAVMSALPLFWGEGDADAILQGEDQRAPLVTHLARGWSLVALDQLGSADLSRARLLLLAQPRGLSPDELVALDRWIRRGGRALVFADPLLVWPSSLAMGDRRRAPPVSLLDPLLSHWGLVLDGPVGNAANVVMIGSDGKTGQGVGVGSWRGSNKACTVSADKRIADCRIGQGRALLVADTDLLDLDQHPDNEMLIDSLILRVAR